MMLINNECFWNYVKALVDFFRKLFITIRELFSEFFLRKFMLYYTSWESIKICFMLSFWSWTLVRRNDNFSNLRFWSWWVLSGFCFVKRIKERKLSIYCRCSLRMSSELSLIHETDLFGKKFYTSVCIRKLCIRVSSWSFIVISWFSKEAAMITEASLLRLFSCSSDNYSIETIPLFIK